MLTDSLRRGLAAGLLAGILAGLFALLVGEIPLREAIALEEAAGEGAGAAAEVVVSRPVQQGMLPVATALVGAALGGLFGLGHGLVRAVDGQPIRWATSLRAGAAAWAGVALFPALVYPANPPAVGDPGTIGSRSAWYAAAAVVGLLLVLGGWWLVRRLRARGAGPMVRQVAVGGAVVALAGLTAVLLPPTTDPVEIPAELLWRFRLASIGTQALLWAGLTVAYGWLMERAAAPGAGRREIAPA